MSFGSNQFKVEGVHSEGVAVAADCMTKELGETEGIFRGPACPFFFARATRVDLMTIGIAVFALALLFETSGTEKLPEVARAFEIKSIRQDELYLSASSFFLFA